MMPTAEFPVPSGGSTILTYYEVLLWAGVVPHEIKTLRRAIDVFIPLRWNSPRDMTGIDAQGGRISNFATEKFRL
eukprot:scaffold108546_cov59-Attheya_sp.AAC.3